MQKIMFNDKYGLTTAVLEGRKTMTRRTICSKIWEKYCEHERGYAEGQQNLFGELQDSREYLVGLASYKVGEVVAIAQSYKELDRIMTVNGWKKIWVERDKKFDKYYWAMRFGDVCDTDAGWNNKMFVSADLMPHHIKITDINVEQLQDISYDDCLREGVDSSNAFEIGYGVDWVYQFPNDNMSYFTPREAFAALIDKVGKKGDWESNPWVFVYEFELVD